MSEQENNAAEPRGFGIDVGQLVSGYVRKSPVSKTVLGAIKGVLARYSKEEIVETLTKLNHDYGHDKFTATEIESAADQLKSVPGKLEEFLNG